MRKKILVFAIAASVLLTLMPQTIMASTSVYKDYLCDELAFGWNILGFIPAESIVKNIRVRVYSDKEINIVGDMEGSWPAIETCAFIQFLTADHADVTVNSFTWSGPAKQEHIYTDYSTYHHIVFPGVSLVGWGGGSGHFDVTLKPSTTEDVFGLSVGVNNLGAGIGLIVDFYMLAKAGISTLGFILNIQKAMKAGQKIAKNLGFVFHVADNWPTTTETISTGSGKQEWLAREYVVYYDERYPTSWISRAEAKVFRDYLSELGFVTLNADDLKVFMQNKGKYSVVVMAQDIAPDTVANTKSSNAIIRQYLDRGGRVVWMEDVPLYYQGHSDGLSTTWGTSGEHDIIGVWEGTWDLSQTVNIKTEGSNRGLSQVWVTQRESDDATVDYVLADEDNYDAAAYVKCFNNGGEFIRIWDNGGDFTSDAYLQDLVNVASTGSLSWTVEMTAYNADSTYARCGDITINGHTKRVISWLNPLQTVTAITTVPGYWFNHLLDLVNAWVTTYDRYDNGKSWTTVKLTSPEGLKIQYYRMRPANRDRKAYFEIEMTGLWHVTTHRYHTAPTAIAYNLPNTNKYDTGSRTKGAFMFTVDLRSHASATLEFYHCYWTESASYGAYDICRLQISTDYGTAWTTLQQWDSRDPNVGTWTKITRDISSYCGAFLQIRFHFDSVDSLFNNYEGWYIDDIAVTGTLQNDAGTGGDASNNFDTATSISPGSYTGSLLSFDKDDWYQFYASSGKNIYVSMTPPSGVDFDLELYNPSGSWKAGSYATAGYTDSVSYTADSSGYWRGRIYIFSGSGQYSFYVSVTTPDGGGGGGGGCPTLFVWSGSEWVRQETLNIHADSDVTLASKIQQAITPNGDFYMLSLRELDEFISHIDYVKLYAVDFAGEQSMIPLTKAVHSELGNVKRQVLHDDGLRVDLHPSQTLDLKFPVLDTEVAYFVFEINGYNMKPLITPY